MIQELAASPLWMNGPVWLKGAKFYSPPHSQMPKECLTEMKGEKFEVTHGLLTSTEPPSIEEILKCEDFSSLCRLLSVTAHVLKFCHILLRKVSPDTAVTSDFLSIAETLWITAS